MASNHIAVEDQVIPSAKSALKLVRGEPNALRFVVRDVLLRASIIGAGLYFAGEREGASALIKKSVAASCAIEAVVLCLTAHSNRKK
jgi:hypothetical protein